MVVSEKKYGPSSLVSDWIHGEKYRQPNETFYDAMVRIAGALKDSEEHRKIIKDILLNMRFMPAGRVQSAVGSPQEVTPYNCFVSGTIPDSMTGIMNKAGEAAQTMRMGGGIGYNFGTIRPRNDNISTLNSPSSGAVSFMDIYDAVCGTVSSAGNRRGAQMGVLPVWHPDIEEFVTAKTNEDRLTRFNISVGITDEFMHCVEQNKTFRLRFKGRTHKHVNARALWDKIMRNTWDWAEPGVLFLDQINNMNNMWYSENIVATNPCGEQPLPPYGACLLGSFNMTKYISRVGDNNTFEFDYKAFAEDVKSVVRMMDKVVDVAIYPLPQHEKEAKEKRRMGLGVTGVANAIEAMGDMYGSKGYIETQNKIMEILRDVSYDTSVDLAIEKGSFPAFDSEKYCQGQFFATLPKRIQDRIREHGIRNSHLISIAPTGTISLSADNITSGIEPVFSYSYERTIQTYNGPITELVEDYGYKFFGVEGMMANNLSVQAHLDVLIAAQKYVDSACSKTLNVSDDVTYDEFCEIYMKAWRGGCKGCTTFRAAGKRYGVLNEIKTEEIESVEEKEPEACFIDPTTGQPQCS